MAVQKPVLFLLIMICTVVVIANQCGKHAVSPREKKVSDRISKQKDEMKKQQENVKALFDRIAAEIAIDRSTCADCSGSSFKKYQDLQTTSTATVEPFAIDGSLFLAFGGWADRGSRDVSIDIYKMDDFREKFSLYQTIDTFGSDDMKYFRIADEHFLAVAIFIQGVTNPLNSVIYKWDHGKRGFVSFQNILTNGPAGFSFFKVFSEFFIAVSNYFRGPNNKINSAIYKWNNTHFEKFQEIRTEGAFQSTGLSINNEHFLVFANYETNQSPVFKWSGGRFVKLQSLKTNGGRDVKSFSIKGGTFLAFANLDNVSNNNLDSFIYKWNGSAFALFQSIPTRRASAWHPFVICGQTYLGVANQKDDSQGFDTESVIYKFSGSQFIKYQEFLTHAASDITTFVYKGHTYLAISNFKHSSSVLYKWV